MTVATFSLPKANQPCWCGSGQKFKRCHKPATDAIRPGRVSPRRAVPDSIDKPHYAEHGGTSRREAGMSKPTADEVERMRRTGKAAAEVLDVVGRAVAPGITTDELDVIVHEAAIERDAYPSPLMYGSSPFPKSVCTSVNEVICHGIPDDRPLRDGDVVNLDVTLYREGVHGDTNRTFGVGTIDPESQRLIDVTHESMMAGIAEVRPGAPFNVIGRAIQLTAEPAGFGVVRAFVGHGVNTEFHTEPQIPHYYVPQFTDVIEEGMTFTIEPMITMGSWEFNLWDDDWTAATIDRKRTAQFEHTIHVTSTGAEILTPWPT